MIELERVSKSYENQVAVGELSLVARPGVVTVLLGPAGSGASTVVKLVLGQEAPSSGSVQVTGEDVVGLIEPAAGLDVAALLALRDRLAGLAAAGATVLVSATLPSEAALLGGRVVVLDRGRVVSDSDSDVAPPSGRARGYSAVPAPYWDGVS